MVKKNVQQLLSLLPVSYFYDQIVLQFRTAKEFLTSRAPLANVRAAYDYLYSPTQWYLTTFKQRNNSDLFNYHFHFLNIIFLNYLQRIQ